MSCIVRLQRWWKYRLNRAVWLFWFKHRAVLSNILNKRNRAAQAIVQKVDMITEGERSMEEVAVVKASVIALPFVEPLCT